MNALELADELEKAPTIWFKDDVAGQWIIKTLRQQHSEIEALKDARCVACGWNPKLIRPRVKEEND